MSGTEQEKCPGCGRPLYSDRPSCLYCEYERPIDAQKKIEMKKKLVSKGLGFQTSATPAPKSAETSASAPLICPSCRKPLKPGSKFCSGCGSKIVEPPKSAPPEPEPAPKPKISGKFVPKHFDSAKPSEWRQRMTPANLLWLLGAVFFIISSRLPFGTIPTTEISAGTSRSIPVDFPGMLWIPALAIAAFTILSAVNLKFPGGGIYDKPFKFGFLLAVTIYNFAALRQTFLNAMDLIVLYIFFLILLYAAGRMRNFLERFEPWSAAALLTGVYFFLLAISLKSSLLSNSGANPVHNAGFYLLLISSILFLVGSFLKRGAAVETFSEEPAA